MPIEPKYTRYINGQCRQVLVELRHFLIIGHRLSFVQTVPSIVQNIKSFGANDAMQSNFVV